jgi:subtilisin family serine protease
MNRPSTALEPSQVDSATGKGIRILVVDSGVETSHPALKGSQIPTWQLVQATGGAFSVVREQGVDLFGHGTAVAWILREFAPEATVESLRVLGGDLRTSSQRVLAGLDWAISQKFGIINCSFGTPNLQFLEGYKRVVDRAFTENVLLVSACNNFDYKKMELPGFFPTVISTDYGKLEALTMRRRLGSMVEFVARGENIRVPWKDGQYVIEIGSSFAAPHVAAVAARIRQLRPDWNACEVKAALYGMAPPWKAPGEAPKGKRAKG